MMKRRVAVASKGEITVPGELRRELGWSLLSLISRHPWRFRRALKRLLMVFGARLIYRLIGFLAKTFGGRKAVRLVSTPRAQQYAKVLSYALSYAMLSLIF